MAADEALDTTQQIAEEVILPAAKKGPTVDNTQQICDTLGAAPRRPLITIAIIAGVSFFLGAWSTRRD